jgi:hypothetical protein
VLGLTTVVAWPIINVLIKENFFVNLQTSFESLLFNLNIENLFTNVDAVIKNFCEIVSKSGLVVQSILCGIMMIVLFVFLEGYMSLAVHESTNGYMSSLTKYAFTNSYVSNFGRATLLNLARLITTVPISLIILIGCYLFASKLYEQIGVIAIILAFLILTILLAVKSTIFSGWKPALIIHNNSVFVSLKRGFVAVSRRFFRTLSNYIILVVLSMVLNLFAVTLTAGVGLLVSVPLTTLLFVLSNQVMYYEAMGMRFYVDSDHIISTKKLEQQDKFAKVKNII